MRQNGTPAQVIHHFKDGSTDPKNKTVPVKIMARMEQILAEAHKRKQAPA